MAKAVPSVIGAGTAILGSKAQKKATKRAVGQSAQSEAAAIAEQRRQFDKTIELLGPRIRGGDKAFQEMSDLLGLGDIGVGQESGGQSQQTNQFGQYVNDNPDLNRAFNGLAPRDSQSLINRGFDENNDSQIGRDEFGKFHYQQYGQKERRILPQAQAATPPPGADNNRYGRQDEAFNRFRVSPGYRFRVQEGVDAADAGAARRGSLLSGRQQKALTEYGQNVGSQEYGNYFTRLASVAGAGQAATNQQVSTGQSVANNIGNAAVRGGAQRASAYQDQGENSANFYNSLGGSINTGLGSAFPNTFGG